MAKAYGRHAKIKWTPDTGGEDFNRSADVLLDAIACREEWGAKLRNIRPLGEPDDDFASFGRGGQFLLRMEVRPDSGLQLPSHIRATVRIYTSRHNAAYREGDALIQRANWEVAAGTPGAPQAMWYIARWCGEITESVDTSTKPTLLSAEWDGSELQLTYSAAVVRGSEEINDSITVIDGAGDSHTSDDTVPTINGTVVTMGLPTLVVGSETPINTVSIAAGVFASAAYPDDPTLETAVVTDFVLS